MIFTQGIVIFSDIINSPNAFLCKVFCAIETRGRDDNCLSPLDILAVSVCNGIDLAVPGTYAVVVVQEMPHFIAMLKSAYGAVVSKTAEAFVVDDTARGA